MNVVFFILLALISFFPILIWAYSFAYIDQNPLNKKRFLVGIFWWILSVFPILYMWNIINFLDSKYLNIFYFLSQIKGFISSLEFWFSLSLFIFLIVILSFAFWFLLLRKKVIFKIYLKNFLVFVFFIIILSIFIFLLNFILGFFDFQIQNSSSFWWIIFDTFRLIMFYYLIVCFLEEASKHFNFLQSSIFSLENVKSWVENAIFVALWFSFVENILYLYNFYEKFWLNFWLVKIYFFRSIFSVIVHVLCSSIVTKKNDLFFRILKYFSLVFSLLFCFIWFLIFLLFLG